MGSRGAFSPEQMVQYWISEKAHYRPGMPFPHVSRTGNWADVAHYTQVVWPWTEEVGCAIASNGRDEFLVCRYRPTGNIVDWPIGR